MMSKQKNRKRRGRGEGSIHRRADGRWRATISVGYGHDGRRKRRDVYGRTKEEVQSQLCKLQNASAKGLLTNPSRTTVAQYLERWLHDVVRNTVRASTHHNYRGVVKNHVSPHIGGVAIQKLSPAHIQSLHSALEDSGASAETRRLVHVVLHRALKQALKWDLVARNVCDSIDPPRITKREINPLTVLQVGKLLSAARESRLEALYVLALGSGLRLGELFGLQWRDLDLDAGTVSIRHSLSEVGGKLALVEPKTAKGRRLVTLPAPAVAALIEHRKKALAAGFAGVPFVFSNRSGGPLRRSHFHQSEFKPLLNRAGLPSIRFHDLRHTSATLLLAQGVHPKVVQERLGHSQISVTLDVYSHVLPSLHAEAARRLDSLLIAAPAENGGNLAVKRG